MMVKNMTMMTNLITKNLLHWQECFLLGNWPPGNDYEESLGVPRCRRWCDDDDDDQDKWRDRGRWWHQLETWGRPLCWRVCASRRAVWAELRPCSSACWATCSWASDYPDFDEESGSSRWRIMQRNIKTGHSGCGDVILPQSRQQPGKTATACD